jgi:ABC-type sulfate transport system permease component
MAMQQAIRYAVVLLTAFIAGSRTVDAAQSWNEWQSWTMRDPSAAEAYRTFFLMSAATAVVSLAIAGLVWWLLRPKKLVERGR